ncbi:hypothetical protein J3E69DRAFT_366569 [Trichoderma sp. SZMC 28015]
MDQIGTPRWLCGGKDSWDEGGKTEQALRYSTSLEHRWSPPPTWADILPWNTSSLHVARCRNLINPNPEKMKARFERAAEDGGYAYVGVSSTLDGVVLVHGLTDDKAKLKSTLAREQ